MVGGRVEGFGGEGEVPQACHLHPTDPAESYCEKRAIEKTH